MEVSFEIRRFNKLSLAAEKACILNMEVGRTAVNIGSESLSGRHNLRDLSVDWRVLLKLVIKIGCDDD
jgi:hypothetical protein